MGEHCSSSVISVVLYSMTALSTPGWSRRIAGSNPGILTNEHENIVNMSAVRIWWLCILYNRWPIYRLGCVCWRPRVAGRKGETSKIPRENGGGGYGTSDIPVTIHSVSSWDGSKEERVSNLFISFLSPLVVVYLQSKLLWWWCIGNLNSSDNGVLAI